MENTRHVYLIPLLEQGDEREEEEVRVELAPELAEMSGLITDMLTDNDEDDDIPLPTITRGMLEKITEFCKYHKNDPLGEIEKPLRSNDMSVVLGFERAWYAEFINQFDVQAVQQLLIAANYLDIKPLLQLSAAKVAALMKGKTAEQIRQTFGIVDDTTDPHRECEECGAVVG